MLKIKLARFGKKKQPHYRIVVNEARDKRDGKYVESIGHYAPHLQPKVLEINLDKVETWKQKGAQPTDTVASLIARFQSGNPFPPKKAKPSKKARAKAAAAKQSEADDLKAANEAAATPVEEVVAEPSPVAPVTEAPPAEAA